MRADRYVWNSSKPPPKTQDFMSWLEAALNRLDSRDSTIRDQQTEIERLRACYENDVNEAWQQGCREGAELASPIDRPSADGERLRVIAERIHTFAIAADGAGHKERAQAALDILAMLQAVGGVFPPAQPVRQEQAPEGLGDILAHTLARRQEQVGGGDDPLYIRKWEEARTSTIEQSDIEQACDLAASGLDIHYIAARIWLLASTQQSGDNSAEIIAAALYAARDQGRADGERIAAEVESEWRRGGAKMAARQIRQRLCKLRALPVMEATP
jgi:hypothetical protein